MKIASRKFRVPRLSHFYSCLSRSTAHLSIFVKNDSRRRANCRRFAHFVRQAGVDSCFGLLGSGPAPSDILEFIFYILNQSYAKSTSAHNAKPHAASSTNILIGLMRLHRRTVF